MAFTTSGQETEWAPFLQSQSLHGAGVGLDSLKYVSKSMTKQHNVNKNGGRKNTANILVDEQKVSNTVM